MQVWQLGTQGQYRERKGMEKVSRDQLLQTCVPEVTGANRLVLKSEVVMILLQRAPWQ